MNYIYITTYLFFKFILLGFLDYCRVLKRQLTHVNFLSRFYFNIGHAASPSTSLLLLRMRNASVLLLSSMLLLAVDVAASSRCCSLLLLLLLSWL